MDHERTALDYMKGCCHVFALAAQSLTGWSMVAAMVAGEQTGGETLHGNGDVVHLYLRDPEGRRFDAFGAGTSGSECEAEMELVLGKVVTTVECDPDTIATMVRMGWLSSFEDVEVEAAQEMAAQVLADEYGAFPRGP